MLDPTRYALNAATVGFRKRTGQSVDWGAFHNAIQNQTDAIKVRREQQETLVSELHVMGGQRFGMEGNGKTNELARQQRQMNGYPLRSFIATGGAIVLPPKHGEGLLAIPMNLGLNQYTQYNAVVGNIVSKFVEPLNAPLENNTILLAKAGIKAQNESASDPYKAMQFNNNMHQSLDEIRANQQKHLEIRGFKRQGLQSDNIAGLSNNALRLSEEQSRAYSKRQKRQAEAEAQSLPLTRPQAIAQALGKSAPMEEFVDTQGEDVTTGEDNVMSEEQLIMQERENLDNQWRGHKTRENNDPRRSDRNQDGTRHMRQGEMNLWHDINELPVPARLEIIDQYDKGGDLREIMETLSESNPEWFVDLERQYALRAAQERELQERKRSVYQAELVVEGVMGEMINTLENRALRPQRQIEEHLLDDAQRGMAGVEAENTTKARVAYENIGETPSGLLETPVRNSVASGSHIEKQIENNPFLDQGQKAAMFFELQNFRFPQTKSAGNNPRTRNKTPSMVTGPQMGAVRKSKQEKEKTIGELRYDYETATDEHARLYNKSKLDAAIEAQITLERGEKQANPKKAEATKTARRFNKKEESRKKK